MNRCALRAVHASITNRRLLDTKVESKDRCRVHCSCRLSPSDKRSTVADVHHKGPAQLLQKVNIPTANTLYPAIPLYALERSIEEIALEPPKAKKDTYWKSRDVKVKSRLESRRSPSAWYCTSSIRKSGMLVALDWVRRKRVKRSWRGREMSGNISMSKIPISLDKVLPFVPRHPTIF